MDSKFQLVFRDITEYEHLVVRIEYDGQLLCQISKENGNDDMDIEFFPDFYLGIIVSLDFKLNDFIEIIHEAKKELSLCP